MPRPRRPLAPDLARAARRFHAWRSVRAKRVIPEDLWRVAVDLARRHGASATVGALHVDYYGLKRRLEDRARGNPAFVEIVPAAPAAPCIVEIEDGRGAKMRVHLTGADVGRVEALERIFLSR